MTLELTTYTFGPLQNRTSLLVDPTTRQAIIIDPAVGSRQILSRLTDEGIHLALVLFTHAHFDHTSGMAELLNESTSTFQVKMHPDDLGLWQVGGGAKEFGYMVINEYPVEASLTDGQIIKLGEDEIEVRHTPGHTQGHVIFSIPSLNLALVGDLIFYLGVGRTDMPGGNGRQLIQSIKSKVLTLPDTTRLLPGHGPETYVGYERENNPFLY